MSEIKSRNTFARINSNGLIEIVCEDTGQVVAVQSDYKDVYAAENLVDHTLRDGTVVSVSRGVNLDQMTTNSNFSYSEVLADIICQKIAEGGSISQVSKDASMPSYSTIARWRRKYPDFNDAIKLAFEDRAHLYHDKAIATAEETEDKDEVPQNRLKVDTYKWAAEKGDPKSYGKQMTVKGDELAPLKLIVDTGVPQVESIQPKVEEREVEEIKGASNGDSETDSQDT